MRAPAAGDRRPVSRDWPLTVSVVTGTFQMFCTLPLASVTASCTLVSRYAVEKSRNTDLKFEKQAYRGEGKEGEKK
eukprot:3875923-Rhodomonas_salina.1